MTFAQRISIAAATLLSIATAWFYLAHRPIALPFHDRFAQHDGAAWTPYGGFWQIRGDSILNESDEWGAKLVAGSHRWSDYALDVDLQMIGHRGDTGAVVRVNDEAPGNDAYSGYAFLLRSEDAALVAGRANYGWQEARPVLMPGGVRAGIWYHLHIVVVGCLLGAQATNTLTHQSAWIALTEQPCVATGRIGLRSSGAGSAWRHIAVTPATIADFNAIRAHTAEIEQPQYPFREDVFDRMRHDTAPPSFGPEGPQGSLSDGIHAAPPVSIGSVRANPVDGASVLIRGIVTMTQPTYMQDDTGGINLQSAAALNLNLGDEIEVRGTTRTHPRTSLEVAGLQRLRDRSLAVPVSITPTLAAEGDFNGRLVEVRGTLVSRSPAPDGSVSLLLTDGEQSFRAVGQMGFTHSAQRALEPGSELRIRGICTPTPIAGGADTPFGLIFRSTDDIEQLAAPPWWTPGRIWRFALLAVAILALGAWTYTRIVAWKMRAVLLERERLAHDLHDTLAQSFAGVGFQLQGVRNSVRSGSMDHPTLLARLDAACTMVKRTHREASAEIAALHLDSGRDEDVLTALERCTRAMLDGSEPPLLLQRSGTPRMLSLTLRDALFQIGREAITNALRHSNAGRITLRLRYEENQLVLEVQDEGRGFLFDQERDSFGLRAMRLRSERIHGTLSILTAPAAGTLVRVHAPYRSSATLLAWLSALADLDRAKHTL